MSSARTRPGATATGDSPKVTIGALARSTGCRVVTIRYYEKEGLLPRPDRSAGNYRLYGQKEADRLRFIRHCRLHGMSLDEIRQLLVFKDNPSQSCDWIATLVRKRIASVETQLAELAHLKEHLQSLLRSCPGGQGAGCGILARLESHEECPYCEGLRCLRPQGSQG